LIAKLIELRRVQRCMQGCIGVNGGECKKLSPAPQDALAFSKATSSPLRAVAIDGAALLAQAAA
jgi:hypothetical protein